MLDKLVDLLISSLKFFLFCCVVRAYQEGIVLRLGKFHRVIKPGFHFLIPFRVEEAFVENVVLETMYVGPQSLTTKDKIQVVIATIVSFTVSDVKVFLLDIEGANQMIEDSCYGVIAQYIMSRTWDELMGDKDLANELSKKTRAMAKEYGVNINRVQIATFTRSKPFHLMQNLDHRQKRMLE